MKYKDFLNAPMVDEVNLSLEPTRERRDNQSAKIRRKQEQLKRKKLLWMKKCMEAQMREAAMRERQNHQYNQMLKKSRERRADPQLELALMQHHRPLQADATTKNPLVGFIPAQAIRNQGATAYDPDFTIYDAVPAQEFNNCVSAKDLHYKDYPLVKDASTKGDFSGVLLQEKGSADFSTLIVNQVRNDFGRLPRRRRR